MKSTIAKTFATLCLVAGFNSGAMAVDAGFMDALNSDARPAEAKARDGIRRPLQVMNLLGVESGMTVVDVEALGGWYTEVLSAAVGPTGHVIAQVGPRGLQRDNGAPSLEQAERLGNVEVTFEALTEVPPNSADAALTALNLHDYIIFFGGEPGAIAYLESIYDVLKPGGVAAIIDHEGSENMNNNELHRIPAADAKRFIQQVGFEIVTESDLLHTNADDHTLSIRDPALGRNTDRFLFIVRKPQ
jgi:predicted methyltransferase